MAAPPAGVATESVLATASPPRASISSTTSAAGPSDAAGAVDDAAEVVDDDPGAATRQFERVRPAEAATGTGDDRDLAVEADVRHVGFLDRAEVGGKGSDSPILTRRYGQEAHLRAPNQAERSTPAQPLPGVPQGTKGFVIMPGGLTWHRYRVRFDNGVELGLVDRQQLSPRAGELNADGRLSGERHRPAPNISRCHRRGVSSSARG